MLSDKLFSEKLDEIKEGLNEVDKTSEDYKTFLGDIMMLESFIEGNSFLPLEELIYQINTKKELIITGKSLSSVLSKIKYYRNVDSVKFLKTDFEVIPEELCLLPKLKCIEFLFGVLKESILPDNLDTSILQTIRLDNNQIHEVSESIMKLSNLKELSLKENRIEKIPEKIKGMENIQRFYLEGNPLKSVSININQLTFWDWLEGSQGTALETVCEFYLLYNSVVYPREKNLEEEYKTQNFKGVKKKIMIKNRLEIDENSVQILSNLSYFEKVSSIEIVGIDFNVFSNKLHHAKCLRSLILKRCGLKEIPLELKKLKKIEYLEICEETILDTKNLSVLKKLKSLKLYQCNLSNFPKEISSLLYLEHCELNDNFIQEIPRGIWKSNKALKFLKIINNEIEKIYDLPQNIEGVDFSDNHLVEFCETEIPSKEQLKNIQYIILENNIFDEKPQYLNYFEKGIFHLKGNPFLS
ncbi:hypothetical protein TXIAM_140118 [Tenacibaculum xiamenense]